MEPSTRAYKIGFESVGDYLTDLEKRFGVIVAIDIRLKEVRPFVGAVHLTVGIPFIIHQLELENPPIISIPVSKAMEQDMAWAMWDALYQYDRALCKHLELPFTV